MLKWLIYNVLRRAVKVEKIEKPILIHFFLRADAVFSKRGEGWLDSVLIHLFPMICKCGSDEQRLLKTLLALRKQSN
jgi:hypothetical protein